MKLLTLILTMIFCISSCAPAIEEPEATLLLRYSPAIRQNASALIQFETTGIENCRSDVFAIIGSEGFVTVTPNEPGNVKDTVDCDGGKIAGELDIQIVEDNISKVWFESQLNISAIQQINDQLAIQDFCANAPILGFYEFTYTFGNGEVKIATFEGRTDVTVTGIADATNLSEILDGSAHEYAFIIKSDSRNLEVADYIYVCNGLLVGFKDKLYKIFKGDNNLITT